MVARKDHVHGSGDSAQEPCQERHREKLNTNFSAYIAKKYGSTNCKFIWRTVFPVAH